MKPAASAPPSPRRNTTQLRSSSGAFDLPSILVGVVVVGILTAGVLAAIFGVIPWAQDRAAKQDLAAINTAQGVTYAKDGQAYKDLAGLEDADLVSGLDPARTAVSTEKDGKAYSASITSASGKKWCISNEDTEPRNCTEPPPGTAAPGDWSGAFCEPELKTLMDTEMGLYLDPLVLEFFKAQMEVDHDEAAVAAWMDKYMSGTDPFDPESMDPELLATAGYLHYALENALLPQLMAIMDADVEEWSAMHAKAVEAYNAAGAIFCETYTGPVADLEEHPSRVEAFDYRKQALTGSQEPVILGYTFAFGSEEAYNFTVSGTEDLAGYKSASHNFEIVDGKPYWTTVLTPGPAGWGESVETANVTVTAARKADAEWLYVQVRDWNVKANTNVLKFTQDPYIPGGNTPGYGDTWDRVIRHQGTLDREILYAVDEYNGAVYVGSDPDALQYEHPEILNMTDGMDAVVSKSGARHLDTGFVRTSNTIYGPNWEENVNKGTVTFRQTVTNPKTFATASHVFSFTVIDPPAGETVHLSALSAHKDVRDFEYRQDTKYTLEFDVPDGYHRSDYRYEATYAGLTADASTQPYLIIEQYVTARVAVHSRVGAADPATGWMEYATVVIDIGDSSGGAYVPSGDVILKATYVPTGESTTIKVKLP